MKVGAQQVSNSLGRWVSRAARGAVHSNLIIASGASGVATTTFLLTERPISFPVLVTVFVVTWFVYTVNRFTDREEDTLNLPARASFIQRYGRTQLALSGLAYLAILIAAAFSVPYTLPILVLPFVGIAIYATWPIKRMLVIKNALVGAVWVLIPLAVGVYSHTIMEPAVWLMASVIFWHVSLAAVLFDVKDITGDRAVGAQTLPIVIGPARTRRLVAIAAFPLFLPVVWAIVSNNLAYIILGAYWLHLLVISPFATTERGPLFYGIAIDGEHLLIAGLALLFVGT